MTNTNTDSLAGEIHEAANDLKDLLSKLHSMTDRKYAEKLCTYVVNHMYGSLSKEEANEPWVDKATGSDEITKEAYNQTMDLKYGKNRVMHDPNNKEASAAAAANGDTVVYGGSMSKGAHQNNRRFGSTISATKKYKDAGVQFSPHGKDVTIPYGKWTDAMKTLSEYAALLHKVAHGVECSVKWVNDSRNYGACYSTDCVMFNKRRLGTRWIEDAVRGNGGVDVSGFHRFVDLCIHEFAHRHSLSHYSDNFYKGCTRIGAAVAVHLGQNGLPDFLYD